MAALTLDIREHRFPAVGSAPAKTTLCDIKLTVGAGERVAIIGPSGCGKTTLLTIVAGLVSGYSGRLDLAPGTRLAYVFQEPRLLPWRSVADNLRLVLPDEAATEERVRKALAEVELESAANVFASRLSLGMARRVALARAFVVGPSLLLLDEPFVSLDEPTARRLRLLLLDLLERHRATVLFVTHALGEAVMLADRLLFLTASPGRMVALREVPLTTAERRRPSAVLGFCQKLAEEDQGFAELLAPSLEHVA
jgi:ABC-type nitrate/sulfonate/bicarbonate transport system ATPase subunit